MSANKYKVESGIQMVLRLTRKTDLNSFYPHLFKSGPKQGHIIEMFSEDDTSSLLCDIICEALIPFKLGGKESGVIIFNTDGKFNVGIMESILKNKLTGRLCDLSSIDNFLLNMRSNLFVYDIYDATQLYATIQQLEGVLMKHSNISLIVFDTLTAFYWSEQNFKIMKMDLYLKNLLKIVQKAVKDYKIVTLYTRPQYFSSSKENIENIEPCHEHPTSEHLNYRIQVVFAEDGTHHAAVWTYNEHYKASFRIQTDSIVWC